MSTCKRVFQVSFALSLTVLSTGAAAAQDQRQTEQQKIEERKMEEVRRLREQVQVRVEVPNSADQKRLEEQKIQEQKIKERLREAALKMRQAAEQTAPRQGGTRGFNVVLVLGDLLGAGGTAADVPEAVQKALADMKDFLPYKSYRLLDAAWILGEGQSTSKLRGIDDHPYSLELNAARTLPYQGRPSAEGTLQMRVRLDEVGEPSLQEEARLKTAIQRTTELRRRALVSQNEVDRLVDQLNALHTNGAGRPVVATSFSMDAGETVVVGTSRINGDKALILLLTAVPLTTASGAQPARK